MSLVGILKFGLEFPDVLAWPLFALGYPVCASIRAIEKNSNSDTQKLVTYWISFSLVSLFEHFFTNLLQWIQFWRHIKLIIICWLVIPYFNGAFYIYNHLVRPYLLLSPQVIVDEFNKWMVLLCKREHFLAEAERYIKGRENLIDKEPNIDVEEIKTIAAIEKKEVEWSHSKEPNIVQKHNKVMEVIEKKEEPVIKQIVLVEPSLNQTENKTSTTMEIKGPTAVAVAARELPNIQKVQKEWTCAICQVTTPSAKTLNLHLQGKKHKAAFEALKPKNQPNIVSTSTAKKTCQPFVIYADEEKTQGRKIRRRKKQLV